MSSTVSRHSPVHSPITSPERLPELSPQRIGSLSDVELVPQNTPPRSTVGTTVPETALAPRPTAPPSVVARAARTSRRTAQKVLTFGFKRVLPQAFFRHSMEHATPPSSEGEDLPRVAEPCSQADFIKKFPPITAERAIDIYYTIAVSQFLFAQLQINATPVGGTVLGMLRNKGQLPHDDDADFATTKANYDKIFANHRLFAQYGLGMRRAVGVSLQLSPLGDKGTFGLLFSVAHGGARKAFNKVTGAHLKDVELTTRGFIDVMAVAYDPQRDAYCYNQFFSEYWWYHQTIPRAFIEGPARPYRYGPTVIMGPDEDAAKANIESVYPHSLNWGMRTADHQGNQNVTAELVPLTEEQKQPFPLSEENLAELQARLRGVGLEFGADGKAQLI